MTMIRAQIRQGRLEIQDPIPEEWEGQAVKILPMTPDDPLPDLEERLAALQALGPMEFEPGERELAADLLVEQDRLSRSDAKNGGKTTVNRYLLDSNHLSAYLDRQPVLTQRIDASLRAGDRFGICLPMFANTEPEFRSAGVIDRTWRACKPLWESFASGLATTKPPLNSRLCSRNFVLPGACYPSSTF